MSLNTSAKYFEDSENNLVFYPYVSYTVIANISMFVFISFFLLTVFIGLDILISMGLLLILSPVGGVLYYLGERKVIVDKYEKAIYAVTPFQKKQLGNLSEVLDIKYDSNLTMDVSCYRCYFKTDPHGPGVQLTPDFMKEDQSGKKMKELHEVAIPLLKNMVAQEYKPEDIPEKSLSDIRLFKQIKEDIYFFNYIDNFSFTLTGLITAVIIILPFWFENYSLFLLLLIPFVLYTRKSSIIIDRNTKMIHCSLLWGMDRDSYSYTEIVDFGLTKYASKAGIHTSSNIWVILKDHTKHIILHRMLFEEKVKPLMNEIKLLLK